MKLEHAIYCGDNLDWMKKMPDEFVDLCYIDPPFFSNKKYEVIFNDGEEIRSFEDRWKGGIEHYIDWMKDRVFEIHRILKKTGAIYIHCDWHASHYLKVMADQIFGIRNFRNEIIWHYRKWSSGHRQFQRNHDCILFYSKTDTDERIFNQVDLMERTESTLKRFAKSKIISGYDETGKRIPSRTEKTESRGVPRDDVWDLGRVPPIKQFFPTQKPESLLSRIIRASSDKGDLVFDPFCGCGTTLVVAEMLDRKWLGIDVSPTACRLMKRRLSIVTRRPIEIVGVRYDLKELKIFKPFEFQNWVIGALGGTTSERKVKDMGIDGYTFMERNPIQVKQSESVGRVVVDNFETALRRIKKEKGIIVGFSFTKDAYEEVARVKRTNHLDITLMTVEEVRKQLQTSN
jgi:DNA modification methylase